jgi:hypothetical protein
VKASRTARLHRLFVPPLIGRHTFARDQATPRIGPGAEQRVRPNCLGSGLQPLIRSRGARSNRPNSTSALARCDLVAAYASDHLEWVNHFNNKSIEHNGIHSIVKKFHTLAPRQYESAFSRCGDRIANASRALRMNLQD